MLASNEVQNRTSVEREHRGGMREDSGHGLGQRIRRI
jgi:hypothetical protein